MTDTLKTISPVDDSVYVERPLASQSEIDNALDAAVAGQRDDRTVEAFGAGQIGFLGQTGHLGPSVDTLQRRDRFCVTVCHQQDAGGLGGGDHLVHRVHHFGSQANAAGQVFGRHRDTERRERKGLFGHGFGG